MPHHVPMAEQSIMGHPISVLSPAAEAMKLPCHRHRHTLPTLSQAALDVSTGVPAHSFLCSTISHEQQPQSPRTVPGWLLTAPLSPTMAVYSSSGEPMATSVPAPVKDISPIDACTRTDDHQG